jgi:hypothetical protein
LNRGRAAARLGALARVAFGVTVVFGLVLPISAAETTGTAATALSISEYFRCPEPFHRGLLTVEPSGAATLVVTRGLDPRKGRSTIHKKQLSREEVKELTTVVRGSGYELIPETTFDANRDRPRRMDACSRSIEITLEGKTRRIRFDHGYDNPPALDAMLKGIHAILDRHEWTEDAAVPK